MENIVIVLILIFFVFFIWALLRAAVGIRINVVCAMMVITGLLFLEFAKNGLDRGDSMVLNIVLFLVSGICFFLGGGLLIRKSIMRTSAIIFSVVLGLFSIISGIYGLIGDDEGMGGILLVFFVSSPLLIISILAIIILSRKDVKAEFN